jgi:hypothetical protein
MAIRMGVGDEIPRTQKEICEKIAKHVRGSFPIREWSESHPVHVEFHRFRPKAQLEPA